VAVAPTSIVLADLRDPAAILAHPRLRDLIDYTRPVALLLVVVLHLIKDDEDPAGIAAALRDSCPRVATSRCRTRRRTSTRLAARTWRPPRTRTRPPRSWSRTHERVLSFFDGFDLLEPGLVQAPLWRPDGRRPRPRDLEKIGIYAGFGAKLPASP